MAPTTAALPVAMRPGTGKHPHRSDCVGFFTEFHDFDRQDEL